MTFEISEIIASPQFREAIDTLRRQHDRLVEEIITLTEIPAPPFKEQRRAHAYEAMFRDLGLDEVGRDAIGNVTGIRRGRANGQMVAVTAHLDTVFPEGTDCTVRREGTKLYAPGIGDDSRGLAVLLAFIRALDAADIETEQDLLFVGDVGEEGAGDLRGIRHLFTESPYRDKITAFFTIDGLELDTITTAAVGSYRYRVTFRGPGGHSFSAFGTVNPAHAMASVVHGLSQLEVPSEPRTTFCASIFGGGTSINAIPNEVWVEIDLRSEGPSALDRLDADLHALIERAVAEENARGNTTAGQIAAEVRRIGNRPAGRTDHDARIVQAALAALPAFGFAPRVKASSTDANIPMSLGVPAIRLGSGGTGGRAHSLEEWIDVEPQLSLRGLSAGLATILGTVGMRLD
jgi:tripeptide aminopeptidase